MRTLNTIKLIFILIPLFTAFSLREVGGLPSGERYPPTFTYKDGYWYDSWGFNRNYYGSSDGFIPNVAYETLGTNRELAYSLGEWFKTSYASKVQRAKSILNYVQKWTEYGFDVDNVVMGGTPQEEWAWNADEMAHMFNATTNTTAIGDCEDMAFLCATIYTGAGFDAALVLTLNHVALLIWLPEFPNANYYWDIPNDGRRAGWIWVEATGERNPLGWTPPDFNDGNWKVYPLVLMRFDVDYTPQKPKAEDNVFVTASVVSTKASISYVLLHYSIQGGVHNTFTMTRKGSLYEANIPKQPDGTSVEFYISAFDIEENTRESDKFSYTVGNGLEIPGFPLESIAIGLIVGIALLTFLVKKKSAPSTAATHTAVSV